jgi:O-antigen/teichoic acid export membrane protein
LTFAVWGLFWGRMVSLLVSLFFTRKMFFGSGFLFSYTVFIRLIKFGGWMTVSNIVSPLMVYFDRFIISNTLGANCVAYYSAPAEGVNRILNIPNSLARALFPKLSGVIAENDKIKLERLSYFIVLVSCIPIVVAGIVYAKYIMLFWMGSEYLGDPVIVLRILLIGLLFNSLAQIPFVKIQAKGNSRTTAFLHLAEVVPYLLLILFMSKHYGLIGVSFSWTIRVVVDFFVLFYFSKK